jgi:hypothetical protein
MKSSVLVLLLAAIAPAAEFSTGQAARLVIGQRTFTEALQGAKQDLVGGVSGIAYADDMLFVVDANRVGAAPVNQRVLIFKNLSGALPKPTDELFYTRPCPVCVGTADVVLGQKDFETTNIALSPTGMRAPTGVASDGRVIAVADTDNNRVLIWSRIPTTNGVPADVVIGQPDFTHNSIPPGNVPTASSMRGPQGVWIQNGKLFVADTQNHRVLIFNSIPTSNGKAADLVLGQQSLTSFVEPDLTKNSNDATPSSLSSPVSVSSDGVRLYVADLGHNRVVIWNSIPTTNAAAADVAVGQPDLNSAFANNSSKVCPSNGTGADNKPTYPRFCEATLDFPRFALSDGKRLFIADGGNDRVLVFNQVPTRSGVPADVVIGELGGGINQASDSTDSMRTPMSLAWDGTNLYVTDAFNVRVMVYTPGERSVPYSGVRNAASLEVFAVGSVTLSGTIKEADTVTITINSRDYKHTVAKDDTFDKVVNALVTMINGANSGAGDKDALATPNHVIEAVILTARSPGSDGNLVTLATTTSTSAVITATTSGATLSGGQDAAQIAPGTLVSVLGDNLSDRTETAPADADTLPTTLANTQVYFDGVRAPLTMVSPGMITAQVPFEFLDRTSISAYVRTQHADGSVTATTPVAVTIVPQNPGIFAESGPDPRPGIVMHGSVNASGTVSVDGSIQAGDTATVIIEDREYSYKVVSGDTLATVRDHLVDLINQDPKVTAFAAGSFTRIRLRAKVPGPAGNGIRFSARNNDGGQIIMTALTPQLCCANIGRVTQDNPASPGETIIVYATGLGISEPLSDRQSTGIKYTGPVTDPRAFVSSLAGGKTANVLLASLQPGGVGVYEVHLELNSDIPTNPFTQLTIAQDVYVSNIITIPVVNPNPPSQ